MINLFGSIAQDIFAFAAVISSLLVITSKNPVKCSGKTLFGYKLSNSGEALKLMVPSYSRKAISGWSNDSGLVTSHKVIENEMGNLGSKSNIQTIFVKEQRVDGSCFPVIGKLRCTLMGFERNYHAKILSKQLNKNYFSTGTNNSISPWFWIGLIDAEGSFLVNIRRSKTHKVGWIVEPIFQMDLHRRDSNLLLQFQSSLGGIGKVYNYENYQKVRYYISRKEDLNALLMFLDSYSLLTKKCADYILFKSIVEIMRTKLHLTLEGFNKILSLKASLNWGLSNNIASTFPSIIPSERPQIDTKTIPDPNWVSGFASGEGTFDVVIATSKFTKVGSQVQLRHRICQHNRDLELMGLLKDYFGTGSLNNYREAVDLSIVRFKDINDKIIPFYKEHPILGIKQMDYLDWCLIANLMNKGLHLTQEGLDEIKIIQSRMNTRRTF